MRVLLIEDEARLASYVKRGLEREGYAVDVAGDGEDGLWLAETNTYDVVILDIMLPKIDGYRVCAEMRERGDRTPVLMLTAKTEDLDEAEALDTGADDFLRKPFSFVVLLARLRALIRRGPLDREAVLEQGDLLLDPARRHCTVSGADVELTPTEFCVLHELVRRPGEVIAKSQILDVCWDWAFDGDPNIVEVYLSRLRRKIDDPTDESRLETVRGAGYRFRPHGS